MSRIENPILKGFNPDPSIVRVGSDYYIATSTFEWFPGVLIHHSKDLVNWELIARPLNRRSQLDMVGNPDSCGVWAPCLSYNNGTFYLVYSNVRSFDGVWKDTPNYLVTSTDIKGDWSEPIFLNSSGFDASLFHDADGRKWYTSMLADHREGKLFGGIILQEYDSKKKRLTGGVFKIFDGSELGITEAPHLYKKGDYYYLITAEGGTEYGHAVSLARSPTLTGQYELHPDNPMISSRDYAEALLQKAGHADLVQTPSGDWLAVFLIGRPLSQKGRCPLGRETAIAEVEWKNDHWLYLKPAGKVPLPTISIANQQETVEDTGLNLYDDFDQSDLNIHFQSLRVPISEDWLTLNARKGFLRLYGRESLNSFHYQSLIARRVQAFHIEVTTCIEFSPKSFQQLAGLICYYNTAHWFYLHLLGGDMEQSTSAPFEKYLQLTSCDNFRTTEHLAKTIDVGQADRVFLKAIFKQGALQFYYAIMEDEWQLVAENLDGSILSDDYVRDCSDRYRPAFTGAFVGLCCQDLTGQKHFADFDWFHYKEL